MELKLFFKNEIIIETIVKPEWKYKLSNYLTAINTVKINYTWSVVWCLCEK